MSATQTGSSSIFACQFSLAREVIGEASGTSRGATYVTDLHFTVHLGLFGAYLSGVSGK